MEENAKVFNEIVETPIWVEKTVKVREDIDKAKEVASHLAKFDARKMLIDKISHNSTLRIPKYSIDFSSMMEIIDEDTSGEYGMLVKDSETDEETATFRFLIQCQKSTEINPFIKKEPYNKPAVIIEFKEYDEYWEIVAAGYGFYEGFEDIDYKRGMAFQTGLDSACKEIINKIAELGVTDEDVQKQIISKLKAKRNYGGIYYVLGCGVEADARIPIRLYKEDYSVKFIYN
jgi:hypothetical protein